MKNASPFKDFIFDENKPVIRSLIDTETRKSLNLF